jgi:hypothetical protein
MERRVPPRRSGTLTGRKSGKRQLDRFDRDLLVFTLSWAPYGGPPENECFVEFGMNVDRVRERCLEVVCAARAAEYNDEDRSLLLNAAELLGPIQRDSRSIAPVAKPKVKRFARRAVSEKIRRDAVAVRRLAGSPVVIWPPRSIQQ